MLISELLPQIEQLFRTDKLKIIEFLASSLAKEETLIKSDTLSINQDYQAIKPQLLDLQNKLKNYEDQYKMSSELFYQKFRQGALGDDIDFFEWSIYYEMLLAAKVSIN